MATAWPDRDAYKAWARVDDTLDDTAIDAALGAVLAAIEARCPVLFGATPVVPDDAYQAALLWTNRTMARRNSPEGIVGSELGAVSVGRFDPDVSRLLSPHVTPVLA